MNLKLDPASPEFFEQKYSDSPDPWNFANDAYEASRYKAILGAISGRYFSRAFEPGCSVGVLTEKLAPYCGELLAIDLSETAVARALVRCAAHPNICIETGSVADIDPGPCDLLVLCEIGYYFDVPKLRSWSNRLLSLLRPGGTLVTCHWLGRSPDHLLSGSAVQEVLHDLAAKHCYAKTIEQKTEHYKLDCWNH